MRLTKVGAFKPLNNSVS